MLKHQVFFFINIYLILQSFLLTTYQARSNPISKIKNQIKSLSLNKTTYLSDNVNIKNKLISGHSNTLYYFYLLSNVCKKCLNNKEKG